MTWYWQVTEERVSMNVKKGVLDPRLRLVQPSVLWQFESGEQILMVDTWALRPQLGSVQPLHNTPSFISLYIFVRESWEKGGFCITKAFLGLPHHCLSHF